MGRLMNIQPARTPGRLVSVLTSCPHQTLGLCTYSARTSCPYGGLVTAYTSSHRALPYTLSSNTTIVELLNRPALAGRNWRGLPRGPSRANGGKRPPTHNHLQPRSSIPTAFELHPNPHHHHHPPSSYSCPSGTSGAITRSTRRASGRSASASDILR